jgi:hypothetical protein
LEEALEIQRESEIIEMTGWTFDEYDEAPAHRLSRMMEYLSLKNAVEKQKMDFDNRSSGGGSGLTGGH